MKKTATPHLADSLPRHPVGKNCTRVQCRGRETHTETVVMSQRHANPVLAVPRSTGSIVGLTRGRRRVPLLRPQRAPEKKNSCPGGHTGPEHPRHGLMDPRRDRRISLSAACSARSGAASSGEMDQGAGQGCVASVSTLFASGPAAGRLFRRSSYLSHLRVSCRPDRKGKQHGGQGASHSPTAERRENNGTRQTERETTRAERS